jgi:hypothetical protein
MSSAGSTRERCAARAPRASSPVATLFHTVAYGNKVGSWKTRIRDGPGRSIVTLSAAIESLDGCSSPEMRRSSVDSLQPEDQSKATNSPEPTDRSEIVIPDASATTKPLAAKVVGKKEKVQGIQPVASARPISLTIGMPQ